MLISVARIRNQIDLSFVGLAKIDTPFSIFDTVVDPKQTSAVSVTVRKASVRLTSPKFINTDKALLSDTDDPARAVCSITFHHLALLKQFNFNTSQRIATCSKSRPSGSHQ